MTEAERAVIEAAVEWYYLAMIEEITGREPADLERRKHELMCAVGDWQNAGPIADFDIRVHRLD